MLTILTPTYNRRHTLPALFESLQKQTCHDFEWLIVDDGSTDDTAPWVAQHCMEAPFTVQLLQQANQGKHIAVNTGVRQARGDWLFIVDSDDWLTPDAVAAVIDTIAGLPAEPHVVGVCFRKADTHGKVWGADCSTLPTPWVASPGWAGRVAQGDLAYVFQTLSMRQNPFPRIAGEKFVPELYIWNKIADSGQVWFYLQRVIYLCEYLDDGYSKNFQITLKRNPKGFLLFYTDQIKRERRLLDKLKALIRSIQCCYYAVRKNWGGAH